MKFKERSWYRTRKGLKKYLTDTGACVPSTGVLDDVSFFSMEVHEGNKEGYILADFPHIAMPIKVPFPFVLNISDTSDTSNIGSNNVEDD